MRFLLPSETTKVIFCADFSASPPETSAIRAKKPLARRLPPKASSTLRSDWAQLSPSNQDFKRCERLSRPFGYWLVSFS
jgi:hypothetical protein